MKTQCYDKLLREAKGYLKDSHESEDGHEIQYDEGNAKIESGGFNLLKSVLEAK